MRPAVHSPSCDRVDLGEDGADEPELRFSDWEQRGDA